MPDADPQRIRRQALPRIARGVAVSGEDVARFEEMPDTFGSGPLRVMLIHGGSL